MGGDRLWVTDSSKLCKVARLVLEECVLYHRLEESVASILQTKYSRRHSQCKVVDT